MVMGSEGDGGGEGKEMTKPRGAVWRRCVVPATEIFPRKWRALRRMRECSFVFAKNLDCGGLCLSRMQIQSPIRTLLTRDRASSTLEQ